MASTMILLAAATFSSLLSVGVEAGYSVKLPVERFGSFPSQVDIPNSKITFTRKSHGEEYDVCLSRADELAFEPTTTDDPASELVCVCANPLDECACTATSSCCEDYGLCSAVPGRCYDDDYGSVTLEKSFPFYKTEFNQVFVNVNGQVQFSNPSGAYDETLSTHLSGYAISAMFDDLMTKHTVQLYAGSPQWPSASQAIVEDVGTIYHRRLGKHESHSGGIVISWVRVAEFETYWDSVSTNLNTFQVALEYDGTITISYLTLTTYDGIVGLSDGSGLHEFFTPIDFSSCRYATGECGDVPDHCKIVQSAEHSGIAPHWHDGTIDAVEGVEITSFILLLAMFVMIAFLIYAVKYRGALTSAASAVSGFAGRMTPMAPMGSGGSGGSGTTAGSFAGSGDDGYAQMAASDDGSYDAPLNV